MRELLLDLLVRVVLLPVTLALATPFVLVWALFGPEEYRDNVRNGYAAVADVYFRIA
jgi:hypothetical protein